MEVEIPRDREFRIEVQENQKVRIMVTAGLAEICGQELLVEKWYNFSSIKTSIFTFTGARLKVEGTNDLQYISTSTCFRKIFNFYDQCKDSQKTVLVLGKGRTTFCSTVSNYSVKLHKKVDFLELDPARGNVFPGALSLIQIENIVDYHDGIKLNNPFCLFYGSLSIENKELYDIQIDRLSRELETRNTGNMKLLLAPDLSNEEINSLIKKFRVTDVIVIGNERLFHKLNMLVPKIFIENSGYSSENTVSSSIHRYFNGPNNEFTPATFIVKFEWQVYRIGEQYSAPESALPLGASRKIGRTDVCKSDLVVNQVLAISEAEREDQIIASPVAGFIVCLDDKKFRILCPQPKLPKLKFLVQGNIQYIDF